ncbi:O-methyltransferase [Mycena capillaripes]|nr:O-methyltransferase [Mycena capillaripes]
MDSPSLLRSLSDIIAGAVTTIEGTYKDVGFTPPSLDDPFNPHNPAEALRQDPGITEAVLNLIAAAGQIASIMQNPVASVLNACHAYHISACLRAASELNVAEILRDAGPQGLHVKEIAAPGKADPQLIARILRLLASHHIFREVSPDVFTTNRISSTLDKGKSVEVLYAKPQERLLETSGLSAFVEFLSDDSFKASAYLSDSILDPCEGQTGHMRALRTDEHMFQWFERPENKYKLSRFAMAMQGSAVEEPEDTMFLGFKWGELPERSVIVDVGGGLGASSLSVAKKYPKLKVINQDRGPVIEQSIGHWKEHLPNHVESGMVEFQVHDFMQPQPVKDAAAFLLRHIVHDWSDENISIVLTHLRAAAVPTTKLVIIGFIAEFACDEEFTNPKVNAIPISGGRKRGRKPLLANFGLAGASLYNFDMTVHGLIGGVERTVEGYYNLLQQCGWNLVHVYYCPPTDLTHVVAEPIF